MNPAPLPWSKGAGAFYDTPVLVTPEATPESRLCSQRCRQCQRPGRIFVSSTEIRSTRAQCRRHPAGCLTGTPRGILHRAPGIPSLCLSSRTDINHGLICSCSQPRSASVQHEVRHRQNINPLTSWQYGGTCRASVTHWWCVHTS